uniref:TIR domain-containing protein n=1 Tax=Otus sunia TaxID=257818 RepID=A0A8C8BKT0_9STRI
VPSFPGIPSPLKHTHKLLAVMQRLLHKPKRSSAESSLNTSRSTSLARSVRLSPVSLSVINASGSARWDKSYDVCICHSEADLELVEELVSYLEGQPESFRCFLQLRDAPGLVPPQGCGPALLDSTNRGPRLAFPARCCPNPVKRGAGGGCSRRQQRAGNLISSLRLFLLSIAVAFGPESWFFMFDEQSGVELQGGCELWGCK